MMNKILAIDDDEEILKLIKTALEIENYQVTTLQEIKVPIVFDKFKGYDLILLDILMPNINGIEFCSKIREEVCSPIIFVSALSHDDEIIQALNRRRR